MSKGAGARLGRRLTNGLITVTWIELCVFTVVGACSVHLRWFLKKKIVGSIANESESPYLVWHRF